MSDDPSTPSPDGFERRAAPLDRPALAVLPFQNLGGDDETDFFLDSLAEDLITELAGARWLSIVARNVSFSYKGKSADSNQIARELGVRFVVEGSLRKAGNRVRISCQLVEAASGQHLWCDHFDGTLEDSFDLQDRITENVIAPIFAETAKNNQEVPPLPRQTNADPPIGACFLLDLLLSKADREIRGDLEEEFATSILQRYGARRARSWFWTQAVGTIATRNPICRWILVSGLARLGEWIFRQIGT
jgi:TolB-like protein